ncbi:hypothetical protein Hypma_004944 [Hypsizygus marmoreus]|uniref:Uncharacterized protein n=1 Tax=Hypsizygus marmoreus TaxID=39966 RepID=A0A369JXH0_HYPMA|nr:hypothetical protein Hypma_004944 [Hypsizygus marmoreus]
MQRPSIHHSDHADSHTHASPSPSQHRPSSVSREDVQPRTLECQQRYDTPRIGEGNVELARFDDSKGISASKIRRNEAPSPTRVRHRVFHQHEYPSSRRVQWCISNSSRSRQCGHGMARWNIYCTLYPNQIRFPFASTIRLTAHLQPLADHGQLEHDTSTHSRNNDATPPTRRPISRQEEAFEYEYIHSNYTRTRHRLRTRPPQSLQPEIRAHKIKVHASPSLHSHPFGKAVRRTLAGGNARQDVSRSGITRI